MQNQTHQSNEDKARYKKSKILRMITAGLVAFFLWFFVITVERTETEQTFTNVEVRFAGYSTTDDVDVLKDRGLKIVSDTEDLTVDLTLYGRRSVLNSLRSSDLYVEVDLRQIYEKGTRELSYEIKYPGDVAVSGIEAVKRSPDTITVQVVSWVEKKIELLKPQIVGEPAEGYRLGDTVTQTDSTIKIAGPKDVIDQIQSAGVVVDVTDATETLDVRQSFVYYDADGDTVEGTDVVEATPANTEVTVPILKEKNVNLNMPIVLGEDAVDTEFTLNTTVTMNDDTTNSFTSVILYEDGVVTLDGQEYVVDENGRVNIDLGQITVFGNTEYVTGGKLKELTLSGSAVGTLHLTGGDIDFLQDNVYSDVASIDISIQTRKKVTSEELTIVVVEDVPENLKYDPVKVILKGFPEDLADITKSDIHVILIEEPNGPGYYAVEIRITGNPPVTVISDAKVYIKSLATNTDNPENPDGSIIINQLAG
ncbi:MAG: hypothetical protein IJB11_04375 [Oscillospiraceae bacterium]|nr:hypothetical protein [Oscillospiraceae bacterium]